MSLSTERYNGPVGPTVRNVLTFDVEEYFHALNLRPAWPQERWESLPRRAHVGVERVLRLLERENTRAEIMADGHSMGEIRPQDRLVVAASDTRLTLLHPPGYDFFGILRSKLHWVHDSRKRDLTAED